MPDRDGGVELVGLPPREYDAAALSRNAFSETALIDPEGFEEFLAARATRVTLAEGGRHSVSVRVIAR